jgi:hypothetical protein
MHLRPTHGYPSLSSWGEKVATPAGEGDLLPTDRHIDRPLPLGEVDPRGR